MLKKGVYENYTWFQSSSNYLSELVGQVSSLVVGKYVAVVAHDGVPLRLTRDELRNGWRQINQVAVSRLVQRPAEIPHNHFDEWYSFTHLEPFTIDESFVNYGGFSLEYREPLKLQRYPKRPIAPSLGKQRLDRFWQTITRVMPESYLLENDKLMVVTCNPELVNELDVFFANARFRLPIKSGLTHRLGALLSDLPKKL